jgi:hypothetical protein
MIGQNEEELKKEEIE